MQINSVEQEEQILKVKAKLLYDIKLMKVTVTDNC